jgi:hypothetical protein
MRAAMVMLMQMAQEVRYRKFDDGRAFLGHFLPFFALCDGINHVESLGVLTGSTAYS